MEGKHRGGHGFSQHGRQARKSPESCTGADKDEEMDDETAYGYREKSDGLK
jgi:hypothetical protein